MEAEPHVAVAPNPRIAAILLLGVPLHGFVDGLQHLVMGVRPAGLGIEGDGNHVGSSGFQEPRIGGTSRSTVGVGGENVAGVKAQPQVVDVRALPAEVAPQALGLPFAAHAL